MNDAENELTRELNGIISARDLAHARIIGGKDSSISKSFSYVREGSLFVPGSKNKRRIWLRESLVFKDIYSAVSAHRKNTEYLLPENFNVDEYLEIIGKNNYLVLKDTSYIITHRFGEDEKSVFLFQDQAKKYGEFLIDAGIPQSSIYLHNYNDEHIDKQLRPFANQLSINRIELDSDIDGYRMSLEDLNANGVLGFLPDNMNVKKPKSIDKLVDPWSIDIPTIDNILLKK